MKKLKTEMEIMKNWKGDASDPLVSISCLTYNHEEFIVDALEGFLMQETNFPFEILIHDDASSDRTSDIIHKYEIKYPRLIKPIFQLENQFSKKKRLVRIINHERAKGRYLAQCEGDDYWIDPKKLEKQVDFLEQNPDYGLVFTDADYVFEKEGVLIKSYDKLFKRKIPQGNVFDDLLYANPYKTCTSLLRTELLRDESYPFLRDQDFAMGDMQLWLHCSAKTKIAYIRESTSVYRVRDKSASHFNDIESYIEFLKDRERLGILFANHYNRPFNRAKANKVFSRNIIAECIISNQTKFLLGFIGNPILIAEMYIKEKLIRRIFLQKHRVSL